MPDGLETPGVPPMQLGERVDRSCDVHQSDLEALAGAVRAGLPEADTIETTPPPHTQAEPEILGAHDVYPR